MIRRLFWMAAGAAAMYFLDPDRGARRRSVARDRLMASARDVQRETEQRARYAASTAEGMAHKVEHEVSTAASKAASTAGEALDDYTLAQKVESELFRDPSIDKGKINVSAENGVVVLRGEAPNHGEITSIEQRVRGIDGVHNVNNMLHLPNTPAPGTTGYSYTE